MQRILLTLLTSSFFLAEAQVFSTTSFKSDGYPISAGFPAKVDKSIKQTATDTMLTALSTSNGVTYALIGSRLKSAAIAAQTIPGIISRLEKKATKIDSKISSSVAGKSSTLLKYVNDKGSNITLQLFSEGRFVYQSFILNKTSFTPDNQANQFF